MFVFHWLDGEDERSARPVVARFSDVAMAEEYGYALAAIAAERSGGPSLLLLLDRDAEIRQSWRRGAMGRPSAPLRLPQTKPSPIEVDVAAVMADALSGGDREPAESAATSTSTATSDRVDPSPRMPAATDLESILSEQARHTAEIAVAAADLEKKISASDSAARGRAKAQDRMARSPRRRSRPMSIGARVAVRSAVAASLLAASLAGAAVVVGSQTAVSPPKLIQEARDTVRKSGPVVVEGRSVAETPTVVAQDRKAPIAEIAPIKPRVPVRSQRVWHRGHP